MVGEQRSLMNAIRVRQRNWIGHILRGNSLLRTALEGKMEGKRTREAKDRDAGPDHDRRTHQAQLRWIQICGTRQTEMASSLPGPANSGRQLRRRPRLWLFSRPTPGLFFSTKIKTRTETIIVRRGASRPKRARCRWLHQWRGHWPRRGGSRGRAPPPNYRCDFVNANLCIKADKIYARYMDFYAQKGFCLLRPGYQKAKASLQVSSWVCGRNNYEK